MRCNEHSKISLESYKKNSNHETYSNYKLKFYIVKREHTDVIFDNADRKL